MSFLFSKRDSLESNASDISSNRDTSESYSCYDLQNLVEDVRNQVINLYIKNPEKYDSQDMVALVEENQFEHIERYLVKHNCKVDKAVKAIDDFLKWRKSTGLSALEDESFPQLFYNYGYMFLYGFDLDGNSVLHVKCRLYHIYHPRVIDAFKELYLHLIHKIDTKSASNGKQWVIILDFSGVTIREVDISLAFWALKVYYDKYPPGLKRVILYNMPWYVRPLLTTFLKMCPSSLQSLLEVVKKGKLDKYISKGNLPRHLGGFEDPRQVCSKNADLYEFFITRYDDITEKDISEALAKYEKVMAADDW